MSGKGSENGGWKGWSKGGRWGSGVKKREDGRNGQI